MAPSSSLPADTADNSESVTKPIATAPMSGEKALVTALTTEATPTGPTCAAAAAAQTGETRAAAAATQAPSATSEAVTEAEAIAMGERRAAAATGLSHAMAATTAGETSAAAAMATTGTPGETNAAATTATIGQEKDMAEVPEPGHDKSQGKADIVITPVLRSAFLVYTGLILNRNAAQIFYGVVLNLLAGMFGMDPVSFLEAHASSYTSRRAFPKGTVAGMKLIYGELQKEGGGLCLAVQFDTFWLHGREILVLVGLWLWKVKLMEQSYTLDDFWGWVETSKSGEWASVSDFKLLLHRLDLEYDKYHSHIDSGLSDEEARNQAAEELRQASQIAKERVFAGPSGDLKEDGDPQQMLRTEDDEDDAKLSGNPEDENEAQENSDTDSSIDDSSIDTGEDERADKVGNYDEPPTALAENPKMKPKKKKRKPKNKGRGAGNKTAIQGPGTFVSQSLAREDRARRRQGEGAAKEPDKRKRDVVVDASDLDARSESEAEGSGRSPANKKRQVDAIGDEQGAKLKDDPTTLQAPPEPPSQGEFEKHIPQLSGMWTVSGRVVVANFEKTPIIPNADRQLLAELAERDDIVLIVEGVLPATWTKEFVLSQVTRSMGDDVFGGIVRFDRDPRTPSKWEESKQHLAMKVEEFLNYLKLVTRFRDFSGANSEGNDKACSFLFKFKDHSSGDGVETTIDVRCTTLYMIDLEMKNNVSRLNTDFVTAFKLPEFLPGGKLDLMSAQPTDSRPFMGPNLYVCPGGGFTSYHTDGRGTVNSGHVCLSGHNEVVVLHRLSASQREDVMEVLGGNGFSLIRDPHGQDQEGHAEWATKGLIEQLERTNYIPIVFTLHPGQMVLIGTGRLHCFRKMSHDVLPECDAHHDLRQAVLAALKPGDTTLCVSIAYDWMFMGATAEGMMCEVQAMLENSLACSRERLQPLASVQFGLWCLAKELTNVIEDWEDYSYAAWLEPEDAMRCRGILPSLEKLIEIHFPEGDDSLPDGGEATLRHGTSYPGYIVEPIFWCNACKQELGNTYCVGSRTDSKTIRDANGTVRNVLCVDCFRAGYPRVDIAKHTHYRLLYPSMARQILEMVRYAVEEMAEAGSVVCVSV